MLFQNIAKEPSGQKSRNETVKIALIRAIHLQPVSTGPVLFMPQPALVTICPGLYWSRLAEGRPTGPKRMFF